MTEVSNQTREPEAPASLFKFRINDTTPFISHADCLNDCLTQASALLVVMETAFRDLDEAEGASSEASDGFRYLRSGIKAEAIEGIKTLVDLALYHADNVKR